MIFSPYMDYGYEFSFDSTWNQWIIFFSRTDVTSFLVYIPQHILHFHGFVHLDTMWAFLTVYPHLICLSSFHDLRNLGILGTLDDSDTTISSSFSMPTSRVTTSCNDFLCIPDTPFPSQLLYYMSRLLYAPPFLAAHDCTVVRHHSPVSWEVLPQVICHAHFLEHRPHHLHI